MLPTSCQDLTSSIVSMFSGCFRLTASVNPVVIPQLPVTTPENNVTPQVIAVQPTNNPDAAPADPGHLEAPKEDAGSVNSNARDAENGQGEVCSRASTARATDRPAQAASSSAPPAPAVAATEPTTPDCTPAHLRWLISKGMYHGPLPPGFK